MDFRVERLVLQANLEMEVAGRGVPRPADRPDHLAGGNGIARFYTKLIEMSVERGDPFPVVEDDHVAVPPQPVPGVEDESEFGGAHLGSVGRQDIQAAVEPALPLTEGRPDLSTDRQEKCPPRDGRELFPEVAGRGDDR